MASSHRPISFSFSQNSDFPMFFICRAVGGIRREQIPRDICTRFGRYLYSAKLSWITKLFIIGLSHHDWSHLWRCIKLPSAQKKTWYESAKERQYTEKKLMMAFKKLSRIAIELKLETSWAKAFKTVIRDRALLNVINERHLTAIIIHGCHKLDFDWL